MTEGELQRFVLKLALAYRWLRYHTHDSRKSHKGFPDLVLLRARPRPRLLFIELKGDSAYGKLGPTDDQVEWLETLRLLTAVAPAVEVHLWTPEDRRTIERVLAPAWVA